MVNFWDYNAWSTILLFAVLLGSLLVGNVLRKGLPFLRNSLIPTSVIGGGVLIVAELIYKAFTGNNVFDTAMFDFNGTATLEVITYHALALGFIASALKTSDKKLTKQRTNEIFDSGVATVATYLLQGIVGMAVTIIAAKLIADFFATAGILLPFGYGQGTGQAMNYGSIYAEKYGFAEGKSFGLAIAAIGFLSASIGGVIHLNIMRRKGKFNSVGDKDKLNTEIVETANEIPMQESIDKFTIQIGLIFLSYAITYLLMYGLGLLLPGEKSTFFGFNFLLGVLCATLVKAVMKFLRKKSVIKKDYTNNFLLTRASNFFYDLMVVAGIAAIRFESLERYWGIIAIIAVLGLVLTYAYNRIVAKTLFKGYVEEQFLAMYGMLTGTASTGIILLREIDGEFKTPAADNLVYLNFPAIAFGFPMLLLATFAPGNEVLTVIIFIALFTVLNIILFRSKIFRRKKNK